MLNILKAEFNELFKGKLIYVLLVAIIIFPLFTATLYKIVSLIEQDDMFAGFISTFEVFKQSFNPVNNLGLLLLILIIVLLSSDFTNNTVRNKLVGGYSKTTIYLTSLLKSFIIVFIISTLYALFSALSLGLLLNFSNNSFKDYLLVYIINMSSILTIYSIVNFLLFIFKSFGKTLGITLAFVFITLIVYSIFMFILNENTNKTIVTLIPFINVFYSNLFSLGRTIAILLVNLLYIGVITTLGIYLNEKIDYK